MATRFASPRQVANALPVKEVNAITALVKQHDLKTAAARANELVARFPKVAHAHLLLAQALLKQTRYREAETAYREAMRLAPNSMDAWLGLAQSLSFLRQHTEALALAKQALKHAPKLAAAWVTLGNIHKEAHELAGAIASYTKALEFSPDDWKIYRALAHLIAFQQDSPVFELLKTCSEDERATSRDRADMHFVLGKAYLDIQQDEQAFFHYQEANRLMDESLPPIRAELEQRLTFTRRRFTQALYEELAPYGDQACPQIIVAGMSRSGKSLVESLFRGVKGVTLAGEELVLGEYTREQLGVFEGKLDRYLTHLTPGRLEADAQGYRGRLGADRQIKITTVPGDLWNLGLVGLWAPKVPIIFCVRNLLDLGMTGYFHQYQVPEGFRYSYNLEQLGRQIACSEKIMDHWAQVLPNPVYLVDYEALSRDPEAVMNNLLGELGLERERPYGEVVGDNAALVDAISPIESSDAPMPVTARFNGISQRFREKLQPLVEGYKTIADAFPRLVHPAAFDQPLPSVLKQTALVESDSDEQAEFDWQLQGSVTVIDNGAYLLRHAQLKSLLNSRALGVVAFDPLSEVTLEPWQQQHPNLQHLPNALLGSGAPATLYACLEAECSATLKPLPDSALPARLRSALRPLATLPVSSVALDAIEGLQSLDWLILDHRHDSATVLEHGKRALADTLLIHAQVSFQPRYERQPSLAELQHWAARHGFRFYRLVEFAYDSAMTPRDDLASLPEATELRQASALFIPAPERMAELDEGQRYKLAFILDTFYQIHDLSCEVLQGCGDSQVAERYLRARGYFDHARLSPPADTLQRVEVALAAGQVAAAGRHLAAWRRDYPGSAKVRELRARAALLAGQDELAFRQMDRAIELAADELEPRLAAMQLLLDTGMWWEAWRSAQALYTQMPNDDAVFCGYAKALIAHPAPDRARLVEASARCDGLLEAQPHNRDLLTVKARLVALEGDFASALEWHDRAAQVEGAETAQARAWRFMQHGHSLCESDDHAEGAHYYWQAASAMPHTRLAPVAAQCLSLALSQTPALAEEASLHAQLRELKLAHKGDFKLGRFGLLKQDWQPAWLPGNRPTAVRLAAYGVEKALPERAKVLDITAEQGMLLLGLAPHMATGVALQDNRFDTEVGALLARHAEAQHLTFLDQPLEEYHPRQRFDLILACGAHAKGEMTPEALGVKLYELCAEQGRVLLESRGTGDAESVEPGFDEKVARIVDAGFVVEESGSLCDDGLNQRVFKILRRR
nr:tetratricopeptide repeat protein [Halomonas socia]